jgi:hypothetical protein
VPACLVAGARCSSKSIAWVVAREHEFRLGGFARRGARHREGQFHRRCAALAHGRRRGARGVLLA